MGEIKTKVNDASIIDFIDAVPDEKKRADAYVLLEMMTKITGCEPKMWGTSIIGFDSYHYVYASGQEGDWPMTGFSPRKTKHSVYIMPGFNKFDEIMGRLGKFKTGKSCLYINKLADVNLEVLEELIEESVNYMRKKHPKDPPVKATQTQRVPTT